MPSLLRRLVDLGRSDDDLAAGELREAATAHGCRPITEDVDRQVVTVAGTVRAVTLRPRATVPALVAEVYDGSSTVQLVWLGRRSIHGIDPGAYAALAAAEGVELEERAFSVDEAKRAREVFVTAASAFVMPLISLDGVKIGDGQPGPVATRLRELYLEQARRGAI